MIIRVINNQTEKALNTYLSMGENAGASTLRVKNTNGFSSNLAVQIGDTGEERSEIQMIYTVGTTINLNTNLDFDHPSDTPVYALRYDQVVFAKSATGTAGIATPITGGTVPITPDSKFTQFDDITGVEADAYRSYFRNSVTGVTTSESDWLTPSGFSFYSLSKLRQRAKDKLFDYGFVKSDDILNDWINEWFEELNNAAIKVNNSYSLGTIDISFKEDGLGTVTATDFKNLKRIWIDYDGVDKYRATEKDISEIEPNQTFIRSHPYYSWKGNNLLEINPAENGGTAKIVYSKRLNYLKNDTDELPLVMRSYTNSFVNYAVSEAYYADGNETQGDRYLARSNQSKLNFLSEITPRDHTGIQTIEITDSIYGEV